MIHKTLSIILVLFMSACSTTSPIQILESSSGHLENPLEVKTLDESWLERYHAFVFDLDHELKDSSKNVFYSPASILLALGMSAQGADKETWAQMIDAFHMKTLDQADFALALRTFQSKLLSYETNTLEIANSLWILDSYTEQVRPDFLKVNRESFGASIASLDFNDPASADVINEWVKKNTKGLIEKIVEPPIDPMTVMFLINTIYFKADWEDPFTKEATYSDVFHGPQDKNIDYMRQLNSYPYLETADYQVVALPYADQEAFMMVYLPKADSSITLDSTLYASLSKDLRDQMIHGSSAGLIELHLPKMDLSMRTQLNENLIALGIRDAFDPSFSDFSKMSSNALSDQLHISSVMHEAVLKVDEKGTEAAAVTSIEMGTTSMPIISGIMKVDHPFKLILADASGAILFMGDIIDPMP